MKLFPRITYTDFSKEDPSAVNAYRRRLSVNRYWSRNIINISVRHHMISLDFRGSWLAEIL